MQRRIWRNASDITDDATTASIAASWPLRQLRLLRTFLRWLRLLSFLSNFVCHVAVLSVSLLEK